MEGNYKQTNDQQYKINEKEVYVMNNIVGFNVVECPLHKPRLATQALVVLLLVFVPLNDWLLEDSLNRTLDMCFTYIQCNGKKTNSIKRDLKN